MKKIALSDVFPPAVYEPIRDEMRRKVIELKKSRRVHLGPIVTLVFENRATLISQICEMVRAERITERDKIQDEIDVYNTLLPEPGELSATLFVEITEQDEIRPTLAQLVGLDAHVAMELADRPGEGRAPARFEAGRSEEERISSVQYVRFRPEGALLAALLSPGGRVALCADHARYRHRVELAEAVRASLARDLSE